MKIYIDLVILLNFCYDFLILICVDVTLKRHAKIYRHVISALIGSISIILLFLNINRLLLFSLKILTSIIMILVSFNYKNIKYFITNIVYLYMTSIILGGFLYLLNNEFSYDHIGLVFFYDGLSINYLLLLITSPLILYLYYKEHKLYLRKINYIYEVLISINNNIIKCNAFLDSGNSLKDPVTKKSVILISKKLIEPYINIRSPMYVPYKALNHSGLVACFKIDYIIINNKKYTNYLVGITNNTFNLNGSECLLNSKFLEDL